MTFSVVRESLKSFYLWLFSFVWKGNAALRVGRFIVLEMPDESRRLYIPDIRAGKLGRKYFLMPYIYRARGARKITVSLPGLTVPLRVRPETTDVRAFEQIFVQEEYALPFRLDPRVIIDGGANVGFASAYFSAVYPCATIFAVEPDETNFRMLQENVCLLPNVHCIRAGIWHKSTRLWIRDDGYGEWMIRVQEEETGGRSVPAVTIDTIFGIAGCDCIDIVKLDIEGSEKPLLTNDPRWLERTRVLIVELHDRFMPGCTKALSAAANRYGFRRVARIGENEIFVNPRCMWPSAKTFPPVF
jgi:FkbM family methyltransferase